MTGGKGVVAPAAKRKERKSTFFAGLFDEF